MIESNGFGATKVQRAHAQQHGAHPTSPWCYRSAVLSQCHESIVPVRTGPDGNPIMSGQRDQR